jgi:hypothetical protein
VSPVVLWSFSGEAAGDVVADVISVIGKNVVLLRFLEEPDITCLRCKQTSRARRDSRHPSGNRVL